MFKSLLPWKKRYGNITVHRDEPTRQEHVYYPLARFREEFDSLLERFLEDRCYGKFTRTFSLPQGVDEEKIDARHFYGKMAARAMRIAWYCLPVRDTGVGIPKQKLSKRFEAFTQADSATTRNYGGTSPGLTITAELVRLMQGKRRNAATCTAARS